jgi:deoxyribonuclease V
MSRAWGWPSSPDELRRVQDELAAAVPPAWTPPERPLAIGGCAIRFPRGEIGTLPEPAWAAAAVLRDGRPIAEAVRAGHTDAAYEPGLLALREGPLLEAAVRALAGRPDVLIIDATGRDHPRRAGLALHLGAVLELPTAGVTHRPLLARGEWPEDRRGAASALELDGEPVGAWLRTRRGVRPIAVHAGWRTTVDDAVAIVLAACGRHRTPEPLRHARRLAREARAA